MSPRCTGLKKQPIRQRGRAQLAEPQGRSKNFWFASKVYIHTFCALLMHTRNFLNVPGARPADPSRIFVWDAFSFPYTGAAKTSAVSASTWILCYLELFYTISGVCFWNSHYILIFARSATGLLLLSYYIFKGWIEVLRVKNGRARAEVSPNTMGNVYKPSFEMCCVPL